MPHTKAAKVAKEKIENEVFLSQILNGTTFRADYFLYFPSNLCAVCGLPAYAQKLRRGLAVASQRRRMCEDSPPLGRGRGSLSRRTRKGGTDAADGIDGTGLGGKYVSIRSAIADMSWAMNPRRAAVVLMLQADVRGRSQAGGAS
jgi:hypothetical protein